MPRGDKSKYTDKQKRKAEHIAEGYEDRGVAEDEAKRRAWATVNAESHGGEKPGGSGYGQPETHQSSSRGGRVSQARRTAAQRSRAAKKAAATRRAKATRKRTTAKKPTATRGKAVKRTKTAGRSTARKSPARKSTARKSPARRSR